jgi:hypothetical protein
MESIFARADLRKVGMEYLAVYHSPGQRHIHVAGHGAAGREVCDSISPPDPVPTKPAAGRPRRMGVARCAVARRFRSRGLSRKFRRGPATSRNPKRWRRSSLSSQGRRFIPFRRRSSTNSPYSKGELLTAAGLRKPPCHIVAPCLAPNERLPGGDADDTARGGDHLIVLHSSSGPARPCRASTAM